MKDINTWDKHWMLTFIKELEKKWWKRYFLCECECWNKKEIRLWHILQWNIKSCWCLLKKNNYNKNNKYNYKHWLIKSWIYHSWNSMKQRCNNINRKQYKNWGGRWITYDKKWETFEWFYEDMKEWYSDELTLDRIDNNWNYCKENCRWTTKKEQAKNRTNTIYYKWVCLKDYCNQNNLQYSTILKRIKKWLSIKEALF